MPYWQWNYKQLLLCRRSGNSCSVCSCTKWFTCCMLRLCKRELHIFSPQKSVAMCILPKNMKLHNLPGIFLGENKLEYVQEFNFLGHTLTSNFSDDEDIKKEIRKLCARGNTLIRKFSFCNIEVKCNLFKTYCYSLYCSPLWCNFRKSTLTRLKVCFNNVLRRLTGVPMFSSASQMFVAHNVMSLPELMRKTAFGLFKRILGSSNSIILAICKSDISLKSAIRERWWSLLYR